MLLLFDCVFPSAREILVSFRRVPQHRQCTYELQYIQTVCLPASTHIISVAWRTYCTYVQGDMENLMGSEESYRTFRLANNKFTGTISDALGRFANAQLIDLDDNQARGWWFCAACCARTGAWPFPAQARERASSWAPKSTTTMQLIVLLWPEQQCCFVCYRCPRFTLLVDDVLAGWLAGWLAARIARCDEGSS